MMGLPCSCKGVSISRGFECGRAHFSRNSWKRRDKVSPVTSTTLGISVRGTLARLPGARAPMTSSSANSTSLFAPALSEGGPRGLAEEDRICCDRRGLPTSLDGVGAASELRTASRRDDIVQVSCWAEEWRTLAGGYGGGCVNDAKTRSKSRLPK